VTSRSSYSGSLQVQSLLEKDNTIKIEIMFGRETRKIFKTFLWATVGDDKKLDRGI